MIVILHPLGAVEEVCRRKRHTRAYRAQCTDYRTSRTAHSAGDSNVIGLATADSAVGHVGDQSSYDVHHFEPTF